MPNTKHAIIRYQALDKCFRNSAKRFFINDLVEACQVAVENFTGKAEGVQKRQVYDDIAFMVSENGYNAPIEKDKVGRKVYYYYSDINFSINNQPLTESEALELKETLVALNRFKGLPQFEWIENMTTRLEASFQFGEQANEIIEFDQNEFLKGKEFMNSLYHAIINKTVLNVSYKSFKLLGNSLIEFHPYYLKQYNNRWFIFGNNPKFDNITNLALDRIIKIDITNKQYLETHIDFKEYFEDIIGVTYFENKRSEKIVLQVEKTLWPYIKTKPLHGSQKVNEIQHDYVLISLELIPNYELESMLLQFGERLTIIKPDSLRLSIVQRVMKMNENYKCAD
ncbi:WYL domain-containing protein [Formosa sediminum]|uniref:WYL domain-containing protein n=1 Tax=Formosa sediminum TaxID=2594004 RepID=A0A516GUW0_9FLAO|nr:WYL domain-containing protein [Formosa sediminum]QDO95308.1 WYL domain-containing protein [Formosa sediminum]